MLSNLDVSLLDSLKSAQWDVATHTFGNSHATLIGLLVQWWIAIDPAKQSVLESGPSFGYHEKGVGGGLCDAVFCEDSDAVGILEVEGTRGVYTAQKIGSFFASQLEDLKSLQFAVLFLYTYQPVGRGQKRTFISAQTPDITQEVERVSTRFPEKSIVVIVLHKNYEHQRLGIRKRNDYYSGRVSHIMGYLYRQGRQLNSATLYPNV